MPGQSTLPDAAKTPTAASHRSTVEAAALDAAFVALQSYDYGSNRGALMPIDKAVCANLGDAKASLELERRLCAVLEDKVTPVAKTYVCGKLSLIGSAESASVLAKLLTVKELSDAARAALESMPCSEAVRVLRESLPRLTGVTKIGVINSLGRRRDEAAVPALSGLLEDQDRETASACAAALGEIGNGEAAAALRRFLPKAPEALRLALADACLVCAERLSGSRKHGGARALLNLLQEASSSKMIQMAAQRAIALLPEESRVR